jgi:hypothetical protein
MQTPPIFKRDFRNEESEKDKEIRLTRDSFVTAETKAAAPDRKKISDLKQSFNGMLEEIKLGEITEQELIQQLQQLRKQLAGYHGGRRKTRRIHKRKRSQRR